MGIVLTQALGSVLAFLVMFYGLRRWQFRAGRLSLATIAAVIWFLLGYSVWPLVFHLAQR